jgi:hypothetical protein
MGRLGTWLKPAPPKVCDVRGNPSGHRRHSRRDEAKGQPEDSDAGSAERERGTGQPEAATRVEREDAGGGATRNLIDSLRWMSGAKLVGGGDRQIHSPGSKPTPRSDGEAARPQTH